MQNRYEFLDDCVCIIDNRGNKTFVDLYDYEKLKSFYCLLDKHSGYFVLVEQGVKQYLHRFIFGDSLLKSDIIDHIDRDKCNNRKSNLRVVNSSQSVMNRGLRKDNKLKCRGVRFRNGKYEARISRNGSRVLLGRFTTLAEAKLCRLEAEKIYFGEYAPQ